MDEPRVDATAAVKAEEAVAWMTASSFAAMNLHFARPIEKPAGIGRPPPVARTAWLPISRTCGTTRTRWAEMARADVRSRPTDHPGPRTHPNL